MNVDSTPRALLVAGIVALACSALVSVAISILRPQQIELQSFDRYRAILRTTGLSAANQMSDEAVLADYRALDARIVDFDTDWFVDASNGHAFDHWQLDQAEPAADVDKGQAQWAPVYLVRDERRLVSIVLPFDGPGMWAPILGYIALADDLNTVSGVVIYRHGDTPGIGDQIEDPAWLEQWRGKQIRDREGVLRFRVTKDANGPHEVDFISGASITTEATGDGAREWLGDERFGPFLKRLREQEEVSVE